MSKKLNIQSITNELEESAFFPSRKTPAVSPPPQTNPVDQQQALDAPRPSQQPEVSILERANATSVNKPTAKRIITRNSFEIYEDQMESLRTISYREKMQGKLGSMSAMVRDAIDKYLLKASQEN